MIEIEKAIFCSGNGQFHTNESDKSNPNKKLLPYKTTTLECIRKSIDKPQKVDKTVAKWVLASSLPSRNFKAQENNGKFWMLWADLDNDTKPIHTVEECLIKIIGNCQYEIYTSKSATEIKQKARILIFLDTCLNGKDWKICQEILNDKLNKSGLTPDRANERTAQLCFLPNKGIFYDSKSNREEGLFDPMKWFYKEVGQKKLAIGCAEKEAKARREQAVKRRAELKYTGGQTSNLIGAFNKAYAVEDILIQAGYKQRGNTFCHPNSSSGSYAASIKNERVNSLNGTDPLNAGEGGHDSFSAFCVLFHEGDIKKAIINAAHQWLKIDGESWNKVKQREFMRKNDNALGQQEKIKSPKQIVINSPATNGVSIGCDATADNSTSGYQTVFSDDSESYYSSLDSRMFEGRPPNVDGVIFDEKKPAEIKTKVPPVPALSVDLIPEPYRAWLADVSYRIQTPPDFSTVSAFVVTGSIIGSGCSIKPKQKDDWDVVPNIWGVCIGRPSILLKTPSMDEVTKLLDKLQAEYKNQFEQEKVEAKFNTLTNKAMLDEVEKEILKKAKGKGKDKTVNPDDMMKLKADYMELTQDVEDEPTRRLFKTNETSVQSMTVLQNENPRGVLVFRDELTGLLAKWDREDGETERSYYLEGWNGSGCYTDSKIGRGLTDAENVCISLLGGLQPDKLRRYLYQAIRGGNDGMMQRLQLAVWPDEPKKWKNVDVYPDKEAKKLAYDIFLKLADMDLPSMEQYKESMTSGLIIDSARLHKAFLMITWKNYMLSNLSRKKTRLCLNTLVNFGHLCQVLP